MEFVCTLLRCIDRIMFDIQLSSDVTNGCAKQSGVVISTCGIEGVSGGFLCEDAKRSVPQGTDCADLGFKVTRPHPARNGTFS